MGIVKREKEKHPEGLKDFALSVLTDSSPKGRAKKNLSIIKIFLPCLSPRERWQMRSV